MAPWSIEWLVRTEGGEREVPAFSFLLGQPAAVRVQLRSIVDAVRTMGPDRWNDTTSHDSMHGVCAQLHEARDRHGQMLYRLYLRWQREHHRVVIVLRSRTRPRCPTRSTKTSRRWPRRPNSTRPLSRPPTTSRGSRLNYWATRDAPSVAHGLGRRLAPSKPSVLSRAGTVGASTRAQLGHRQPDARLSPRSRSTEDTYRNIYVTVRIFCASGTR